MSLPLHRVDVDRLDTWTRYRAGLCDRCHAHCCTMPVEVRLPDLVRLGLVDAFEAEHVEVRHLAKRLIQARVVARFNHKDGIFTLARRANGDCLYLDPQTRRCTTYETRPTTCRKHPQVGPRPGFCPYGPRAQANRADPDA
ncbi:YkgJ family cysteine cluster protein [Inhella gelatinilytica]|uniref:YkgJ family cysteine cluster protein n=1 Tax=Inhella gelatinilytica TaxID=2795030 RepID=A0A931NDW6_9BURK|nr:YkgJ family cysteine cluster protein [Inhella gelatinilytica]MBH9551871.1 YkgJ family cysteine cluster protein [Inhella gelatinilytica]